MLNSPPKPHAFVSLPVQSSPVPPEEKIYAEKMVNFYKNCADKSDKLVEEKAEIRNNGGENAQEQLNYLNDAQSKLVEQMGNCHDFIEHFINTLNNLGG